MRELHRRRDADLREAGNVLRCQALRVLDSLPEPLRLPHVARRLECIERGAVGAVADRMHADGPARLGAGAHDLGELLAARDRARRCRRAIHAVREPSVPSMNTFR